MAWRYLCTMPCCCSMSSDLENSENPSIFGQGSLYYNEPDGQVCHGPDAGTRREYKLRPAESLCEFSLSRVCLTNESLGYSDAVSKVSFDIDYDDENEHHFPTTGMDKESILKLYESNFKEMNKSKFLKDVIKVVKKNGKNGQKKQVKLKNMRVKIYKLGSLSIRQPDEQERHNNSLHQFVFITSLIKSLNISHGNVDFCFDSSSFSATDKEIITKEFGFNVVLADEEDHNNEFTQGRVDTLTLFYVPNQIHSTMITNGILSANWSIENLPNVIILGNGFQNILDTVTEGTCIQPYGFIEKAKQVVKEVKLKIPKENRGKKKHSEYPSKVVGMAFNNTSLHVFPPNMLSKKVGLF